MEKTNEITTISMTSTIYGITACVSFQFSTDTAQLRLSRTEFLYEPDANNYLRQSLAQAITPVLAEAEAALYKGLNLAIHQASETSDSEEESAGTAQTDRLTLDMSGFPTWKKIFSEWVGEEHVEAAFTELGRALFGRDKLATGQMGAESVEFPELAAKVDEITFHADSLRRLPDGVGDLFSSFFSKFFEPGLDFSFIAEPVTTMGAGDGVSRLVLHSQSMELIAAALRALHGYSELTHKRPPC